MPRNVPPLRDLLLDIEFFGDGKYYIWPKEFEYREYPALPQVENRKLSYQAGLITNIGHEVEVSESYLSAVANACRDVDPKNGSAELRSLIQKLTAEILHVPFTETDFLNSLPSNPYSPAPLGRITVVYDDRQMDLIPWELVSLGNNQDLRARCPIVRRFRKAAREETGPLDLPLNVLLEGVTGMDEAELKSWGEDLFDDFTRYAQEHKGIDWGTASDITKTGEIRHIVFDSRDEESASQLDEKIDSLAHGLPPRLLILHDISQTTTIYLQSHLVRRSVNAGADAVLLVGAKSDQAKSGNFFPTFYRKLVHNQAIDEAVWRAQAESIATPSEVEYILGLREGGEYGLLLTGAVVEAQLRQLSEPKRKKKSTMRGKARPKSTDIPPRSLPRRGRMRNVPSASASKSSARATVLRDEMVEDATRRLEQLRSVQVDKVVASLSEIGFDEEEHGIDAVVSARRSVEESHGPTAAAMTMVDDLEGAAPEVIEGEFVRLTNLWITDRFSTIGPEDYLIEEHPYRLHLQIGKPREGAIASEVFNEEALKTVFDKLDEVALDVVFFSTTSDFEIHADESDISSSFVHVPSENSTAGFSVRVSMRLPKYGSSNEVKVSIRPLKSGSCRIRTCIYYRNVMLQSVLLEAEVAQSPAEVPSEVPGKRAITARTTDYVATVDFALLDQLPQPSLNLFTNETSSGTHWIGAFSTTDTSAFQLSSGSMRTLDDSVLNSGAKNTRAILTEIEGQNSYMLDSPWPVSPAEKGRREEYFRKLAVAGWALFHPLFVIGTEDGDDNAQRLDKFRNTTKDSHIVSIARCSTRNATIPWAALYSNPLDSNEENNIKLCEVFKKQLDDNKWEGENLIEKKDLLDDPKKCRGQSICPLNSDQRKLTVCPFGFWGYIHQVEQPLQQVTPASVDEIPTELKDYRFGQTSFINHSGADLLKVGMGVHAGMPDIKVHGEEIRGLKNAGVTVDFEDNRTKILDLFRAGGQHFFYFYCHGEVVQPQNQNERFRLLLGSNASPGYISSTDLLPDEISWEMPKPLFIMNGCETMAVTPDLTHGFLHALKRLGASGIIGTEVKVWTQLARPFGLRLLKCMVEGMSVGEAFLEVRKYLLRQLNPLGLVYTYYSPATLHLHDPVDCNWCKSHRPLAVDN